MYSELNKKCESMIDELMTVKADCLIGNTSEIKSIRHENLLNDVNRSINALVGIQNTIKAFFSEE